MLNKIGGLARALYIVLAIVAGFVALSMMNVPLVLVVLGLIAGIALPEDRLVLAAVALIALPIVGAALATYPGDRRAAQQRWRCNLQLAMAGALATAIAIRLYRPRHGRRDGHGRAAAAARAATAHVAFRIFALGSAAPSRRGLFLHCLGERRLHQAACPRGLDRRAEALLHQGHHAAHVLHRRSAGLGDDLADLRLGFGVAQLRGRKRSITAISPSSAAARSSRPFLR